MRAQPKLVRFAPERGHVLLDGRRLQAGERDFAQGAEPRRRRGGESHAGGCRKGRRVLCAQNAGGKLGAQTRDEQVEIGRRDDELVVLPGRPAQEIPGTDLEHGVAGSERPGSSHDQIQLWLAVEVAWPTILGRVAPDLTATSAQHREGLIQGGGHRERLPEIAGDGPPPALPGRRHPPRNAKTGVASSDRLRACGLPPVRVWSDPQRTPWLPPPCSP